MHLRRYEGPCVLISKGLALTVCALGAQVSTVRYLILLQRQKMNITLCPSISESTHQKQSEKFTKVTKGEMYDYNLEWANKQDKLKQYNCSKGYILLQYSSTKYYLCGVLHIFTNTKQIKCLHLCQVSSKQ